MFGVSLIAIQAARKGSGAGNDLACGGVVAVRFLSGESVVGDFLENAFAKADGGDGHAADVQIAAKREESDGGNAHDVGAVAAHGVSLHALTNIAPEYVWEAFAQERQLQHGEAVFAWTWGDASQRFRVAAKGDGDLLAEIWAVGQ